MMVFWPTPLNDETLYSIISRYHNKSGNLFGKMTSNDVFGNNAVVAIDFPIHIDKLLINLPQGHLYSAEDIIKDYTMFKFYTAFLSNQKQDQIIDLMKTGSKSNILLKIGLTRTGISPNKYLKYCPECFNEDIEKYQEPYWHRQHQIHGIVFCAKHETHLKNSNVLLQRKDKYQYLLPEENHADNEYKCDTLNEREKNLLITISKYSEKLLNNNYQPKTLEWFQKQYINLITIKYMDIDEEVLFWKLQNDFYEYFGENLLNLIQCRLDKESQQNWFLAMLWKKGTIIHPIHHILLCIFLDISIEDLFYKLFEPVPYWKCRNPVCNGYQKPVIKSIEINCVVKSRNIYGVFECDCGYKYKRDLLNRKKNTIIVIKYGPVWENKLRDLINQEETIRTITTILKISKNALKTQIRRLKINSPWTPGTKWRPGKDDIGELREKWLSLMNENPNATITELKRIGKALYGKLLYHDKTWYQETVIEKLKNSTKKQKISWNERDEEYLGKVKVAVRELRETEGKPIRISKKNIIYRVGYKEFLERKLHKIPKTKKFIEDNMETVEEFQWRRVQWAIRKLQSEGNMVSVWKVSQLAGIGRKKQTEWEERIENLIITKI